MEISSVDLQQKLNNGEKVIVEFWGTWCGPCKIMKPIFEKVARENTSEVQMYTMDIDTNRDAAIGLGIRSIPTIKIFNGQELVDTRVGVLSEGQINGLVTELING
jgi:thioredoxin 1